MRRVAQELRVQPERRSLNQVGAEAYDRELELLGRDSVTQLFLPSVVRSPAGNADYRWGREQAANALDGA